ncbi:hypothetical protein [Halorubrum tebenquichense]|uniref:Uncharacterized protein n=1 Tax=Halorubrum tebenquichense DSM 14210 TaxID=1227485 RepID=M0DTP4_9EURY|nr:hypothetical protein [Halorubrum tebenquichense]ELZ38881.1 hypothetical protein C472_05693 [Halorubrum tebenquichense DSM 14210]
MSGDRQTSLTSDDFRSDGRIQWTELGKTLLTSVWLAWGSFLAGVSELVFGLLGSLIEWLYSGYATLLSLPFEGWTGLLRAAWRGAAQSIAGFGLGAWFVAIIVIVAFFLLAERAFRVLTEGVQP